MHVRTVTVCEDRIDIVVEVCESEPLRTAGIPEAVDRALALLPGLARHRCRNGTNAAFVDEAADTEIPHLFEHIVLEIMGLAGSPRTLRGETRWDFERDGRGVFRISVEYDDDLVCLGAIKLASGVLAYVIDGQEAPDVPAEVARIADLRAAAVTPGELGVDRVGNAQ